MDYRFQPKGLKSNLGWYDRGYIPHFDGGEIPQFLTFRLFDSLPQSVVESWRADAESKGEEGKTLFRKRVENYIDKGHGSCFFERRARRKGNRRRVAISSREEIRIDSLGNHAQSHSLPGTAFGRY